MKFDCNWGVASVFLSSHFWKLRDHHHVKWHCSKTMLKKRHATFSSYNVNIEKGVNQSEQLILFRRRRRRRRLLSIFIPEVEMDQHDSWSTTCLLNTVVEDFHSHEMNGDEATDAGRFESRGRLLEYDTVIRGGQEGEILPQRFCEEQRRSWYAAVTDVLCTRISDWEHSPAESSATTTTTTTTNKGKRASDTTPQQMKKRQGNRDLKGVILYDDITYNLFKKVEIQIIIISFITSSCMTVHGINNNLLFGLSSIVLPVHMSYKRDIGLPFSTVIERVYHFISEYWCEVCMNSLWQCK